jgi:hypothetical protein
MATRKQRSRRLAVAQQHQRQQRARLRAALDAALPGSMAEVTKRMARFGYYPGARPGTWKRTPASVEPMTAARRGPALGSILAKRKRKRARG